MGLLVSFLPLLSVDLSMDSNPSCKESHYIGEGQSSRLQSAIWEPVLGSILEE